MIFGARTLLGPIPRERMDLKADSEDVDYKRPAPIEVFATRSTLHGISHMFTYERKYIKRSLWIVFFMASVGVLVMVCVDRVQFYFAYPHVTKLDEVAAAMIMFPAVTICNLNSFRFSRVTRNDLYHAGELLALLDGRYVHLVCSIPFVVVVVVCHSETHLTFFARTDQRITSQTKFCTVGAHLLEFVGQTVIVFLLGAQQPARTRQDRGPPGIKYHPNTAISITSKPLHMK